MHKLSTVGKGKQMAIHRMGLVTVCCTSFCCLSLRLHLSLPNFAGTVHTDVVLYTCKWKYLFLFSHVRVHRHCDQVAMRDNMHRLFTQVRDLTFELDRSSLGQRLCGGPRTKLLLLEGLSFEVRGGEILAIIATSGERTPLELAAPGARRTGEGYQGQSENPGFHVSLDLLIHQLQFVYHAQQKFPSLPFY